MTVLPWNGSHVDYQTSTWFTLPMVSRVSHGEVLCADAGGYWAHRSCGVMQVEGTIVLFRDADSLEMPRLLSR